MCEKNDKRNALIELNMKLFEKIVSDIWIDVSMILFNFN
jgi:hypothetical protein